MNGASVLASTLAFFVGALSMGAVLLVRVQSRRGHPDGSEPTPMTATCTCGRSERVSA